MHARMEVENIFKRAFTYIYLGTEGFCSHVGPEGLTGQRRVMLIAFLYLC